jgi:hypothetical protein
MKIHHPDEDSKGILQIAYYFPPIKTVGTLRNARFYQLAPQYWKSIQVITTAHAFIFDQEAMSSMGDAQIHRISSFDFRWFIWRFSNKNTTHFSTNLKKKPGIGSLRRALDGFPLNLLIGDGGIVYILKGYRQACKLIQQGEISHLYSSFRPMSDHFLAFLLARRFPHLIWIADFRDIPVDPRLKNVFFPRFQHRILKWILQRARLLTTVSDGLAQHLREHYGRQVEVLYNAPRAQQAEVHRIPVFDKFTVLYTGALYPGLQSAVLLFWALQRLVQSGVIPAAELQIVVCGKDGALWREWATAHQLEDILKDLGQLPHPQVLELQHASHLNLLLSWNSPELMGIVTSKLFEYLQAQKPILALVNGSAEPELEKLLQTYAQHSLILHQPCMESSHALEQFLLLLYQNWKQNQQSVASAAKSMSWETEMAKVFLPCKQ